MKNEPLGYITDESLRRLKWGGNDSRGTVPIHQKPSRVAKHPVYAKEVIDNWNLQISQRVGKMLVKSSGDVSVDFSFDQYDDFTKDHVYDLYTTPINTTEILKRIADIAHCGGLIGFKDVDKALTEIRKLSLPYWDKEKKHDN